MQWIVGNRAPFVVVVNFFFPEAHKSFFIRLANESWLSWGGGGRRGRKRTVKTLQELFCAFSLQLMVGKVGNQVCFLKLWHILESSDLHMKSSSNNSKQMSFQSKPTFCLWLTTELSRVFLLFDHSKEWKICSLSRFFNVTNHLITDVNNCKFATLRIF